MRNAYLHPPILTSAHWLCVTVYVIFA